MLHSNSTAAVLNQAWLRSNVKKVSPKYYSANWKASCSRYFAQWRLFVSRRKNATTSARSGTFLSNFCFVTKARHVLKIASFQFFNKCDIKDEIVHFTKARNW